MIFHVLTPFTTNVRSLLMHRTHTPHTHTHTHTHTQARTHKNAHTGTHTLTGIQEDRM